MIDSVQQRLRQVQSVVFDRLVLVVGGGSIGKRHLANLKTLGARVIAYDEREDRRRDIMQQFGVDTVSDLRQGLASGAEAALICTPTSMHIKHALAAAQAGCHLFIEKPLSHNVAGLDDLTSEITHRNLKTLVGCNFRFHPGLRHAKALVAQGFLGKMTSARAQFGQYLPDWHPWEDYRHGYSARQDLGGGVVLDRIHEIDYLRWLFGEITEVYAMIGHCSSLEIDTEDTAEMLLRFRSGGFGSIHVDYVRRPYDCSFSATGEQGMIEWCYQDNAVSWYSTSDCTRRRMEWPSYSANQMYLDEMRHFLQVVSGEAQSECDIGEGRRVLELALAAKDSAAARASVRTIWIRSDS